MLKNIELKEAITTITLSLFAFLINFYVGSRGVYPVDTFIHFDSGYRILLGEVPVRDYWIVHGFLIDYIQAIFFYLFGNNWFAYLFHSSIFNSLIVIFTFYIFKLLKIKNYLNFTISLGLAILAYPVSGTPFLDLHSAYFCLFSIFFIISAIIKEKNFYWFWASFLLCIAFFSKQVPATYVILGVSLINIYLTINKKNYAIATWYFLGAVSFFILLTIFLFYQKTLLKDFILQIFLFPSSIGTDRYTDYDLNFKNVILDYKFVYIFLFIILSINVLNIFKKIKYIDSKKFIIFVLVLIYTFAIVTHQIYTKNQIFIFFLIPILTGFSIYFLNESYLRNKNIVIIILLSIFVFSTLKYNNRFNIERKFHELSNIKIENSYDFSKFDKKFKNLKWISPYYVNPNDEIQNLNLLRNILNRNDDKLMLITEYKFFSLLLNKKFYSPSRTFDNISYPKKNKKYFKEYQTFLIDLIKKNDIKLIVIFENKEITRSRLNHLIYDYLPKNCFKQIQINKVITKLEINSCKSLSNV